MGAATRRQGPARRGSQRRDGFHHSLHARIGANLTTCHPMRKRGERETRYSACTPEAFTIGGQRFISSARQAAYSADDQNFGSKPSLAMLAARSGDFIA